MYCTNCGIKNFDTDSYCVSCGQIIVSDSGEGTVYIGKNTVNTLRKMIGQQENHYLNVFKRIEKGELGGGTGLGLIWPIWALYRKMYIEFFFLMGILFIFNYVSVSLGFWVGLLICLFMIGCGRKLYYQSIVRKLDNKGLTGIDVLQNKSANEIVSKMGGTSWVAVIVYLVCYFFLYLVIMLLFAAILL